MPSGWDNSSVSAWVFFLAFFGKWQVVRIDFVHPISSRWRGKRAKAQQVSSKQEDFDSLSNRNR
jgi:hypothetical protein